jgi:hypothetical protein
MSFVQNFNNLFSPMDKKYCAVFHGISMFYFFIMVIAIIHFVFLFQDIKRNKNFIFSSIIAILTIGINYIYNRLLFNMCK